VHDAVLVMFVVTMTCQQLKQIREALIYGSANVFKGPINSFAGISVSESAADEIRRNPAAELWQIHFSGKEAAGPAVHVILPQNIIPVFEEYVMQHRALLAGGNDPGTLFLNMRGGPLGAPVDGAGWQSHCPVWRLPHDACNDPAVVCARLAGRKIP